MTESKMKKNFLSLSVDELWALHEEVSELLSKKIKLEKRKLEERLAKLNSGSISGEGTIRIVSAAQTRQRPKAGRKYPPVVPKFRNPDKSSETWAGRGKQPRWLVAQIKTGKVMDDFLIKRAQRSSEKAR
jgi:DNA-binding protein H-NS